MLVALAALAGLVALISSRDKSTFNSAQGPGVQAPDQGDRHLAPGTPDPHYATDPPLSGAHVVASVTRDDAHLSDDQLLSALESGDIVLAYRDAGQARALKHLQQQLAGSFDAAVAASGQAVILDRGAGPRHGAQALAWRHSLTVASGGDPALAAFVSFWLGRGAAAH